MTKKKTKAKPAAKKKAVKTPEPKRAKSLKQVEPTCQNCLLYHRAKGECKVAILVNGQEYHMPVFPNDRCHMDELGIPVEQVRWFVTDPKTGKQTSGNGVVQIEYPEGFFGKPKAGESEDELLL